METESSDWTLYYSEEGYPYYYNAKTGESQWAEYDSTTDYAHYQHESKETVFSGQDDEKEDDEREDEDDEGDEDSDEETESDSDEENDEERQAKVVDRILEEKFKQFLRTPEGMAAMEAEQARLARAIEKKERKRAIEHEKDYVKGLQNIKKQDDGRPAASQPSLLGGIFSYVESAAGYWTSKKAAEPASSSKSNKGKSKSDKSSTAKATATEDSTKQATHRKPHSSANTQQEPSEEDYVESGVGSDARSIRSGSNSSLSSSDHGSVSSDDSDIVTINAPFMSEFANYLSLSSLHANYVVPVNEYLTEHNVYDNSASVLQNVSNTTVHVLRNVTSATITLTQQGLFYTGAGLLSAFSLLFERLNPVLLNFMSTVVDQRGVQGQGAPRVVSGETQDGSSNIEGGGNDDASSAAASAGSSGLYNGGVSPHTKKSSKSNSSARTPRSATNTPRAPTTPRTPRGLPPGYSGGLLPTARVEGVSSVTSTPFGTPLAGLAISGGGGRSSSINATPSGPTVTWKVYEDDSQSTEITPIKAAADTSAVDVSVLTEVSGVTHAPDGSVVDQEDAEEDEGGTGLADTSYISVGDESAHPQMGEVYSAPPTPGDGLVYESNPIRGSNPGAAAASSISGDGDTEGLADTSYISVGGQSAQPQMGEVYSAPPTPAEGLVYQSNPFRESNPAAAAALGGGSSVPTEDVAESDEVLVVGGNDDGDVGVETEAKDSEVVKNLSGVSTVEATSNVTNAVSTEVDAVDLKDISLNEGEEIASATEASADE